MKRPEIKLFLLAGIFSCTVSPQPINYQKDQCHACKMMISDPRFGAELVTKKGKVFKFDAIECMVPEILKNGIDQYAIILATNYSNPGELVEVKNLDFLISPQIPSPMGKYLSAHCNKNLIAFDNASWYAWYELLGYFEK